MSRLRVAPIVEGHGDDAAIRILLQRIWNDIVGGEYIDVLRPIRRKRQKVVQEDELRRSVGLASLKLGEAPGGDRSLVMLLIDADDDCPEHLSQKLLDIVRTHHANINFLCVIAKREFESWFVAAAESLDQELQISGEPVPTDPEAHGKAWIRARFKGTRYSETLDQPALTAKMDLALCRNRSPSFARLCRKLESFQQ